MKPDDLARAYRVAGLIDYGPHRGNSILIATGAGLLMAAMDALPSCRWAMDLGGMRGNANFREFITGLGYCTDRLVICAWFSITDPAKFVTNLHGYPEDRLIVYSQPDPLDYGIQASSMDDMTQKAAA